MTKAKGLTLEATLAAVLSRLDESQSNYQDYKRSENKFNEGYYLGYLEALKWVLGEESK